MNTVFNTRFVSALRSVLKSACADCSRALSEEIAEALAKEGYDCTPEVVALAISTGVANTERQAWGLFPGRYGGIREMDLVETAKLAAEQAKRTARANKAWETRRAHQSPEVQLAN